MLSCNTKNSKVTCWAWNSKVDLYMGYWVTLFVAVADAFHLLASLGLSSIEHVLVVFVT